MWKFGYGFLFAFHSNYGPIFSHFGDIQRQTMAWPWNLRLGSFRVSIVYYYNGAQRYEQFLQGGQLYWALILLSLALFRAPLCLRSSWCYICIKKFFCLHPSLYLLGSWAWWDWPLTWLTNHHPSVLWCCWLGHLTRKIVSEMTYNVSSGTLNTTIPYHTVQGQWKWRDSTDWDHVWLSISPSL